MGFKDMKKKEIDEKDIQDLEVKTKENLETLTKMIIEVFKYTTELGE
jgi:hypothetical protein